MLTRITATYGFSSRARAPTRFKAKPHPGENVGARQRRQKPVEYVLHDLSSLLASGPAAQMTECQLDTRRLLFVTHSGKPASSDPARFRWRTRRV
jgi:hypothetical protein